MKLAAMWQRSSTKCHGTRSSGGQTYLLILYVYLIYTFAQTLNNHAIVFVS